jgi:Uma2 family endonuclease
MIELTRNDYEPDIVFFNKAKSSKFTDEQMLFPAPDFIVEILSPSTEKYDRKEKFIDYAAHGVAEYWIIDPELEIVEQYISESGRFNLYQKLHRGQLESKIVTGFIVDLKDVFN